MSTRTSDGMRRARFAIGSLIGAAIAAAIAPTPGHAGLLSGKVRTDFSTTLPNPEPVLAPANGAIYQADSGYAPLYEGWRARRIGDPLTIVLVESTAASKSSSSKLDSKGSGGIVPPSTGPLSFAPPSSLQASGTRGFTGSGTADQSNNLSGEVSVTVAKVFPNGTMLVQGGKRVTLNRGDEFVQIRGIVRMADVDADNRVLSTRVADAQIEYTGRGDVARAARQGWFSRFFSMLSPF